MAFIGKGRALLFVIPVGFLISVFYVNCSQVIFSQDMSSFSKSGYASTYQVDEDTLLKDKLNVESILAELKQTGSTVEFKLTAQPGNGKLVSLDSSSGAFEYKPNQDFFGEDTFRFSLTIKDPSKESPIVISQAASINVLPINDAPILEEKEVGVASENGTTDITISAIDVDDKNLTYDILSMSNGGRLDPLGDGKFAYYPQCGFNGVESVNVRVADSHGASDEGVVTLRVTAETGTITLNRTLAQDTSLDDNFRLLIGRCIELGASNNMVTTGAPSRGSISNLNPGQLSYTYRPNSGYSGADSATFSVTNGSFQKSVVVNFTITKVNKLPSLNKDTYEVYQNGSLTFNLDINDPDDAVVQSFLTPSKGTQITTNLGATMDTLSGRNEYRYVPPRGLKNVTDQIKFYLYDSSQQPVTVTVKINILSNPIVDLKPGLAARGLSCTICHAQINANVISDFGHGSTFVRPSSNWSVEPYLNLEMAIADKKFPVTPENAQVLDNIKVWESGRVLQTMHVPNGVDPVSGQSYKAMLQSLRPKTYSLVTFPFGDSGDLLSGTLAGAVIPAAGTFGAVSSYSDVYIGAPTAAEIINRMTNKAATHDVQGSLQGLGWRSGSAKTYFTNTSTVVCEGDIVVKGTVLLSSANIQTISGCRIYATGPIFVQGPLNISSPTGNNSLSNVQLSSAVAIMMGVGMEAIGVRQGYSLPTRGDTSGHGVMNTVAAEAANIGAATIQDAMRHSSRRVQFSRLLLNAPQVHSRYNDVFRGTIIAEIAVMSPGEFVYYFDDVFLNSSIEILPLLHGPSILRVK
ncbi:MAG: tandem-95 repeat protein [Bdellovibrio sp.]|nr:tandem-95 repeat protein [Bdellovibrio sp.]